MGAIPWIIVVVLLVFITIWMALTFTNTLCTGTVGFGLCYNTATDPACPTCPVCPPPPPTAPSTSPSTSPSTPPSTSPSTPPSTAPSPFRSPTTGSPL